MRDNYFEENRRMLVRHQADATTQPGVEVCLAVAERPRNVSPVSILSGTGERRPWRGGVRPAPTPTSGRADRGPPASLGRADGRQIST